MCSPKLRDRQVDITERRCGRGVFQCSVQDGIYALRKSHMRSTPSLRGFHSIAFETVPIFVWLTMAFSRPFKEDRALIFFYREKKEKKSLKRRQRRWEADIYSLVASSKRPEQRLVPAVFLFQPHELYWTSWATSSWRPPCLGLGWRRMWRREGGQTSRYWFLMKEFIAV